VGLIALPCQAPLTCTASGSTPQCIPLPAHVAAPACHATTIVSGCSERVEAGGFSWAYRRAEANPATATPDKMPVLCLHGLGSSSYAYRNTVRLLAEAGHEAIAVDWVGHGASSKVRVWERCGG
jgi:hypothetical protein